MDCGLELSRICITHILLGYPCCPIPEDMRGICYGLASNTLTYISDFVFRKLPSEAISRKISSCRSAYVMRYRHFFEVEYYYACDCDNDYYLFTYLQAMRFPMALVTADDRVIYLPEDYTLDVQNIIEYDISYWRLQVSYFSRVDIKPLRMAGITGLLRTANDNVRFVSGRGSFDSCESQLFVDLRTQDAVIDLPYHTKPVRLEIMNYYHEKGKIRLNAPVGTTIENLSSVEIDAEQVAQIFLTFDPINQNYFMALGTSHLGTNAIPSETVVLYTHWVNALYYTPVVGAALTSATQGSLGLDPASFSSATYPLVYESGAPFDLFTTGPNATRLIHEIGVRILNAAIANTAGLGPVNIGFILSSNIEVNSTRVGFAKNLSKVTTRYTIFNRASEPIQWYHKSDTSGGSPVPWGSSNVFTNNSNQIYLDNAGSALTITPDISATLNIDYANSTTTQGNILQSKFFNYLQQNGDFFALRFYPERSGWVEVDSINFQEV